ncbi:hypothetical protein ACIBCT_35365 [Streptosporangium sp. NPDC050855]|uniref:hypothetical protein n=1 Tax=Streptosporangium sp. NPDC050855 TaxID=3366194 RepID=UPI0037890032
MANSLTMYLPVSAIDAMSEKAEGSGLTLSFVASALVARALRDKLPPEFLDLPKFERGLKKRNQNVYVPDSVWTADGVIKTVPENERPRFVTALMYAYSRCLVDVQLSVTVT